MSPPMPSAIATRWRCCCRRTVSSPIRTGSRTFCPASPARRQQLRVEHEGTAVVAEAEPAEHRHVVDDAEVDLAAGGDAEFISPAQGGGERTLECRHLA